jgi:hypothetical protein
VTLAQLPVRLPVRLSFAPEAGVGWAVSRSDIGLVSGGPGPVTRSSLSVDAGPGRALRLPVRYVIVVTLTIFWLGRRRGSQNFSRPSRGTRTGPSGPRSGDHAAVTKNFSEPGFESSAGRELHPTCAGPIRLAGPGRRGDVWEGLGALGRFDGVLIAV